MFRRLVATSRAPQIMVSNMLRSFGKIGPQIDQIWAWLSRGHRWSPGVRNPLKSSVTGPSLLVNCYLEIKFHKIIRVNPPPPLNVKKGHFLLLELGRTTSHLFSDHFVHHLLDFILCYLRLHLLRRLVYLKQCNSYVRIK